MKLQFKDHTVLTVKPDQDGSVSIRGEEVSSLLWAPPSQVTRLTDGP